MRLDGPGKSPLIQSPQVVNLVGEKARRKLVNKVDSATETEPSQDQSTGGEKLAQILEILGRSKERKKKKQIFSLVGDKVIRAYKASDKGEGDGHVLDVKV